ncbi:MAG: hypothetical protein KUG77_04540 [Nannocystaceae bacterium]|nr:hypothetical protein [Nannocystaceae bacterium]
MRKGLAVVFFGLLGCRPTGPSSADDKPALSPSPPEVAREPDVRSDVGRDPAPVVEAGTIEVLMTAATLADDCGGGPNTRPKPVTADKKKEKGAVKSDRARMSKAKRRCQQSSIQLSISAPQGTAPTTMTVKSVELLLASGESVGMLETRSPSVWSDADGYAPWDEKVEPGQDLSVTYAVTSPQWNQVKNRRSQSYSVKAVISIAGSDQTLKQNVVVDVPASLPPNVKT